MRTLPPTNEYRWDDDVSPPVEVQEESHSRVLSLEDLDTDAIMREIMEGVEEQAPLFLNEPSPEFLNMLQELDDLARVPLCIRRTG